MTKRREGNSKKPSGPGRAAVLWDATWRVRRNLAEALAELRAAQQDRAFFATDHGLEAAPTEDRVTAKAVCRAQPCSPRRQGPPPVPSL